MSAREHHQKVKEILGAVLESSPAERELTLNERCRGDEKLRREVEALLQFDVTTQGFRGDPFVLLRPEPPESVGERIGAYKVLGPLGEGGMGAVYRAEKDGEIGLKVALKVLHRGMNTDAIVQRFRNERRILAHLHHPMIGQIYDGGATDDGRLYFAMELVEGKPIDDYCRDAGLSVRERLALFQKVCEAVAASHRNLVAHLDLKPSNLLVTVDGTPKLLDFGIAKILDTEGEVWTRMTALGPRPMTPPYASPEQVQGEHLGAPSDIFSLGVILYELLTGVRPFSGEGMALRYKIAEKEPQRPSTLIRERAGREGRKISRPLMGDLDAIVMKALCKKPDERYASVERFSEDIGNYLAGLPVKARVHSFRYRAGKFVRRNRWRLLTAAAFLALAIGFLVTLVVQLQQVRKERELSILSTAVFFRIVEKLEPKHDELNPGPEEILKRGEDLFGERFAHHQEAQATVLDSVGRVYVSRGSYEKAKTLYERALEIRREIWGEIHPQVAETLHNLARSYKASGDVEEAVRLARRAVEIQRQYYGKPSRELAAGINNYGSFVGQIGRDSEAEELLQEALRMKISLFGKDHLEVANTLANLGGLSVRRKDYSEARYYYQQVVDIRRKYLREGDLDLAASYGYLGMAIGMLGDSEAAVPMLRQSLQVQLGVLGEDHPRVATAHNRLAFFLERTGKLTEAKEHLVHALRVRAQTYGKDDTEPAIVERNLAVVELDLGDALACETRARSALSAAWPEGHWRIADLRSVLGACLAGAGSFEEAEPLLLQGYQALLEAEGEESLYVRDARRRLFDAYTDWNKPEEAAAFRDEPPPAKPD